MVTRRSRDPVDEVLLAGLRRAMAISVRAADEMGDLSPVQLRALTVLQETPRANLNDLAQAMGVTVSTTSRLVDRLVAAGLVNRTPSPQTRRGISLGLTPAGRGGLQRYDPLPPAGARACFEGVSPGGPGGVVAALQRV